jgi:cytochrome c oxidase cbb3-type subunit I/II
MQDPTSMSPGSIMPAYSFMLTNVLDLDYTASKIRAMQMLGVPYPKGYDKIANEDVKKQAAAIQADPC